VQYFAIKNAKRQEPTNSGQEPGLKGKEKGGLNPLFPPPHNFTPKQFRNCSTFNQDIGIIYTLCKL